MTVSSNTDTSDPSLIGTHVHSGSYVSLPRVVISKGLYSPKCFHCGLLTSISQSLFLVPVNCVHEVFSVIFSLVGTAHLDSASREGLGGQRVEWPRRKWPWRRSRASVIISRFHRPLTQKVTSSHCLLVQAWVCSFCTCVVNWLLFSTKFCDLTVPEGRGPDIVLSTYKLFQKVVFERIIVPGQHSVVISYSW